MNVQHLNEYCIIVFNCLLLFLKYFMKIVYYCINIDENILKRLVFMTSGV